MTNNSSLEKYIAYTEKLKTRLDVYFSEQKEFLKCKMGCDLCCRSSYYPASRLEYEYVRIGLNKIFTAEEREKIKQEWRNRCRVWKKTDNENSAGAE